MPVRPHQIASERTAVVFWRVAGSESPHVVSWWQRQKVMTPSIVPFFFVIPMVSPDFACEQWIGSDIPGNSRSFSLSPASISDLDQATGRSPGVIRPDGDKPSQALYPERL
jgi:hypothetical protein